MKPQWPEHWPLGWLVLALAALLAGLAAGFNWLWWHWPVSWLLALASVAYGWPRWLLAQCRCETRLAEHISPGAAPELLVTLACPWGLWGIRLAWRIHKDHELQWQTPEAPGLWPKRAQLRLRGSPLELGVQPAGELLLACDFPLNLWPSQRRLALKQSLLLTPSPEQLARIKLPSLPPSAPGSRPWAWLNLDVTTPAPDGPAWPGQQLWLLALSQALLAAGFGVSCAQGGRYWCLPPGSNTRGLAEALFGAAGQAGHQTAGPKPPGLVLRVLSRGSDQPALAPPPGETLWELVIEPRHHEPAQGPGVARWERVSGQHQRIWLKPWGGLP